MFINLIILRWMHTYQLSNNSLIVNSFHGIEGDLKISNSWYEN